VDWRFSDWLDELLRASQQRFDLLPGHDLEREQVAESSV
jgi:hypothetical protein